MVILTSAHADRVRDEVASVVHRAKGVTRLDGGSILFEVVWLAAEDAMRCRGSGCGTWDSEDRRRAHYRSTIATLSTVFFYITRFNYNE